MNLDHLSANNLTKLQIGITTDRSVSEASVGRMKSGSIAVVGATGHTGRFVVAELDRRGFNIVPIARAERASAVPEGVQATKPVRTARIDNLSSLDEALAGAVLVINCAGPFLDTAEPVVDAAIRAQIPYLDVAAEQTAVQSIFDSKQLAARAADVTIIPGAAFFGGLADLLATALVSDGAEQVAIEIAVGLDSWRPTLGTRLTGQRNTAPRVVRADGQFRALESPPAVQHWTFPHPIGRREVVIQPLSEIITIASHLSAPTIRSWMNTEPLRDLRDPTTPPPEVTDHRGRSGQWFAMDVVVEAEGRRRRASAVGQDIYFVTAPIIVEAAQRLLAGATRCGAGVYALGAAFEPRSFLASLAPPIVTVSFEEDPNSPI